MDSFNGNPLFDLVDYVLYCPEVFMLSADTVMDSSVIMAILATGHSRIPVLETRLAHPAGMSPVDSDDSGHICSQEQSYHYPARFVGVILSKELLLLDLEAAAVTAGQMVKRALIEIPRSMPLFDVLALMKACGRHMALVYGPDRGEWQVVWSRGNENRLLSYLHCGNKLLLAL